VQLHLMVMVDRPAHQAAGVLDRRNRRLGDFRLLMIKRQEELSRIIFVLPRTIGKAVSKHAV